MIAISYLDGNRLSRAMIAGAHFVAARAEALNKINVFPVADGDTGTNVAGTLQKIASGISRVRQRHIREMSKELADQAVGGARGNSGAILAQFFCGFSEGLPDSPRVSTRAFGAAVVRAAESAYSAIARPVEGTILTVIRDWARHVADRATEIRDFGVLLPESLKAAKFSLENTPKQMKLLQKAGVVDAGAQGFVYLLEGIVKYLREAARLAPPPVEAGEDVKAAVFDRMSEAILFRYCTEVLLEGDAIDRDALRRETALLGDSIVMAGGASRIRLHVHTNEPEKLFAMAAGFAAVAQTKVEDMRAQHESRFDKNRAERVGIVTDSTCDLPASMLEDLNIGVVPVRVYFGSENYLDKVTLFIAVPTLKHLVRGGRVSPLRGFIAKLLGLLPVLTISREGKAEPAAKARGYDASRRKMMELLFEQAGEGLSTTRRFGVAHCDAEDVAEELAREIRERFPETDVMIVECGPALGAHGGPGALAVAVLP